MSVITLEFGPVTRKTIVTDNDFISHMLEHLAWRLGCAIDLQWQGEDWLALGRAFAGAVRRLPAASVASAAGVALGMIDDGSAEVEVDLAQAPQLILRTADAIDLQWFLDLRCEQLPSGRPLQALLEGLSQGLAGRVAILVCSLHDPHHTWEAVFRGVGMALSRIFPPPASPDRFSPAREPGTDQDGLRIANRSCFAAEVIRTTAESGLRVLIDFAAPAGARFSYQGAPIDQFRNTPALSGFQDLLGLLADHAGFRLEAAFSTRVLSSSHVLLEDTGMVIGRTLREILIKRMTDCGINGAGSSVRTPADLVDQPISVGVSVEGRKFCQFVPLYCTRRQLYRDFIIGHSVCGGLFSEDLDDFFDGLCWGLACSLVVHCKQPLPADLGWRLLFTHLGIALAEVFSMNPSRKGVPPGVKASLG